MRKVVAPSATSNSTVELAFLTISSAHTVVSKPDKKIILWERKKGTNHGQETTMVIGPILCAFTSAVMVYLKVSTATALSPEFQGSFLSAYWAVHNVHYVFGTNAHRFSIFRV